MPLVGSTRKRNHGCTTKAPLPHHTMEAPRGLRDQRSATRTSQVWCDHRAFATKALQPGSATKAPQPWLRDQDRNQGCNRVCGEQALRPHPPV